MINTLVAWLLLTSQLAVVHTAAEVPRVVRMQTSILEGNRLGKRDSHSVILGNAVRLYYVNASVGTPYQKVALQIDTGSSDVWMFGPGSCHTETSYCLGGSCKSHSLMASQWSPGVQMARFRQCFRIFSHSTPHLLTC